MADIKRIRAEIVIRTTEIRLEHGLGELLVDANLSTAAQGHAQSMAQGPGLCRYAHHVDGKGPDARVTDAGYRWSMVSENIAWSQGHALEKLAECFVDGWWNSPHHRENMLEPRVEDIGIGLAKGTGDEWFGVENFGLKAAVIGWEYASLRRLAEQGKIAGEKVLKGLKHKNLTADLHDHIYYCHHCGQPHEYDPEQIKASGGQPGPCTACSRQLRLPFRIRIGKGLVVLLKHDTKLFLAHLDPTAAQDRRQPIAEVTQHPRDPAVLGLKNLSSRKWRIRKAGGLQCDVPPGRSARLAHGVTIDFGGVEGEIRL